MGAFQGLFIMALVTFWRALPSAANCLPPQTTTLWGSGFQQVNLGGQTIQSTVGSKVFSAPSFLSTSSGMLSILPRNPDDQAPLPASPPQGYVAPLDSSRGFSHSRQGDLTQRGFLYQGSLWDFTVSLSPVSVAPGMKAGHVDSGRHWSMREGF